MTWDPLLSDDWPTDWAPFTVEVQPLDDRLTLVGAGTLDGWTAGVLLRTLVAVYEPGFAEVHLDLQRAHWRDGAADEVLRRCRAFVEGRRGGFLVSEPPAPPAPLATDPSSLALPAAG
jgi:hypothetical protein